MIREYQYFIAFGLPLSDPEWGIVSISWISGTFVPVAPGREAWDQVCPNGGEGGTARSQRSLLGVCSPCCLPSRVHLQWSPDKIQIPRPRKASPFLGLSAAILEIFAIIQQRVWRVLIWGWLWGSQQELTAQVPITRWMDKTAMVHLHNRILLGHKKKENFCPSWQHGCTWRTLC